MVTSDIQRRRSSRGNLGRKPHVLRCDRDSPSVSRTEANRSTTALALAACDRLLPAKQLAHCDRRWPPKTSIADRRLASKLSVVVVELLQWRICRGASASVLCPSK